MSATDLCPICEEPLEDGRPIQTSLDGNAAHAECVVNVELQAEGEDL